VCVYLGIAITGASDVRTDLVSTNQIADYSFVTKWFTDKHNVILRCATGLGPSGAKGNTVLGEWYFNGNKIPLGCGIYSCWRSVTVFEVRGAQIMKYPGVINLYLCGKFTTNEEGVYSCIMKNSSTMNQTMRAGLYFSGRSESFDMYLIVNHLSTQLLQW